MRCEQEHQQQQWHIRHQLSQTQSPFFQPKEEKNNRKHTPTLPPTNTMEEIKKLAEQFDRELISLEESQGNGNGFSATDIGENSFSARSFENAMAESEKEFLQDTIEELTSRTEELEDRIIHQNFIIEMLKMLNEKLYEKAGTDDEDLNLEIEKLNEILTNYNQNSSDLDESNSSYSKIPTKMGKSKSNLRLTVQLGEMQITESKLRGSIASLTAKLEEIQRSKIELERERNEERLRRIDAESKTKAYSIAYSDAIKCLKKIEESTKTS